LIDPRYCRRGEGIKYPDTDRLGAVDDGKVPAGAPDPQTAAALEKVDEIVHKVCTSVFTTNAISETFSPRKSFAA
jgi:hypothetical protein